MQKKRVRRVASSKLSEVVHKKERLNVSKIENGELGQTTALAITVEFSRDPLSYLESKVSESYSASNTSPAYLDPYEISLFAAERQKLVLALETHRRLLLKTKQVGSVKYEVESLGPQEKSAGETASIVSGGLKDEDKFNGVSEVRQKFEIGAVKSVVQLNETIGRISPTVDDKQSAVALAAVTEGDDTTKAGTSKVPKEWDLMSTKRLFQSSKIGSYDRIDLLGNELFSHEEQQRLFRLRREVLGTSSESSHILQKDITPEEFTDGEGDGVSLDVEIEDVLSETKSNESLLPENTGPLADVFFDGRVGTEPDPKRHKRFVSSIAPSSPAHSDGSRPSSKHVAKTDRNLNSNEASPSSNLKASSPLIPILSPTTENSSLPRTGYTTPFAAHGSIPPPYITQPDPYYLHMYPQNAAYDTSGYMWSTPMNPYLHSATNFSAYPNQVAATPEQIRGFAPHYGMYQQPYQPYQGLNWFYPPPAVTAPHGFSTQSQLLSMHDPRRPVVVQQPTNILPQNYLRSTTEQTPVATTEQSESAPPIGQSHIPLQQFQPSNPQIDPKFQNY